MKLVMVLALALSSSLALAQTAPKKSTTKLPAKPAPAASTPAVTPAPANTTVANGESGTMKILKEKLQIRYFGEFLGPSIRKWEDNQIDTDGHGGAGKGRAVRQETPINLFNQFSFRWKVGEKTRAFWDARFTTQFGDRNEVGDGEDQQVIVQEDQRIGLNYGYWTSADKVWSTSFLPRVRLPTSEASQDSNIVLQPDILHVTSFQATPALNISLFNAVRYYWYEQKVDSERYRIYTSPSVTYVFNDTFELFVSYEHELSHRDPEGKSNFFLLRETLQDIYAGVNINITPSLTVFPFLRLAQLQRLEWDDQQDTAQVGAWIIGNIF